MSLPPINTISYNEWFRRFSITTPTFELTPVEKPDMSPFLIHMTSRNAIISILHGNNGVDIPANHGFLQSGIPENSYEGYDARVVCFTESPTFCIDFFRRRKYQRWVNDMRFGIGFDKSRLCRSGVRPVFYADRELVGAINAIHHNRDNIEADNIVGQSYIRIIEQIYPLLFPLLESRQQQGFMWEREWRYPEPDGLTFPYTAIKIICCPEEEEEGIRNILGNYSERITFIRAWNQYDDVTNYLRHQEPIWNERTQRYQNSITNQDRIRNLEELIQSYKSSLESLELYDEFISHFGRELEQARRERTTITERIERFEAELATIQQTQP